MADIAGVVVSPVLQVAQWLAAPIWSPLKYLYNYSTNFINLEEEVKKLKDKRYDVERKVTAAERNVEEINENVKKWQMGVEKTIGEAEQLIQEKENNPRCFKGLCPNFIIRYKRSKKAFKLKRDDVDPLLQQKFHEISFPTNPPEIWLRSSEDYLAFESRNSTVKNVRDALKDETVDKIGVFGMGGLGKTTLVQEVGRKAKKENLFEEIVFVEVTESPDTKKIQTTIAKKLGLKIENESESEIANKLYERMKGKNILLILDNIWEDLDLTKTFGIPSGVDRGRNKLLLTTRDKGVLRKMDCTKNFGMGMLNEEEAWTLFAKMAGNVVHEPALGSLPKDVCKECGGLPIVICTISKALKNNKEKAQWEVDLRELQTPYPTKLPKDLIKEYGKIKLSFDHLERYEWKRVFIICSLMENNASILDLLKIMMGLDIFGEVDPSVEDTRNELKVIVKELKNRCLLLDGETTRRFSMHDVIRTIAITCVYTNYHVYTENPVFKREWKDKDKLRKCKIISLFGNDVITQLSHEGLNCPELEFFQASQMGSSFEILKEFFTKMSKLKVLKIVGLQQSSLPSSIDLLTNLQTLCLDRSSIEDVAIIGELKKLKVLSLQQAKIEELPMEMGQLTELRSLDLTECWRLKVIAPNVISKLSKLEELYMKGCVVKWKIELLKELELLSGLTSLQLDILDNKALPQDFFSKELKRYQISIGYKFKYVSGIGIEHETLRTLIFTFNSTISLEELCGIKNVEVLYLCRDFDDENDPEHSKVCVHSNEIIPFFNKKVIFPDLEVLILADIISRKIWDSQLPTSSFQNLKQLELRRCTKIKYVFLSSIAKRLQQLQYIQIWDCEVLEGIVDVEEGIEPAVNVFFPQVAKLELENLPEFTDFSPGIYYSEWPKLKELAVQGCGKFKIFTSEPESFCFGQKVIFSELQVLKLKDIISRKIWDSQLPTSSFQNLKELRLQSCTKIKYVFPSSIARSLQQLQYIVISDCDVLEGIVDVEEGTEPAVNVFFPEVTKLELVYLPEFTDFYPGIHYSEWPKLKELEVEGCDKFKMFTSKSKSLCLDQKINHDLNSFQLVDIGDQFEESISWWGKCLEIYNYESVDIPLGMVLQRFENLTVLDLRYCHRFLNLITPSTARSLAQLRELKLVDCRMLIEILENEGDATTEIVFEKLNKLLLSKLESLVCFCSGSYTFNFPSLEELNITECPAMKTFCGGILTIPKLKKINYERKEEEIERNNLNEILQRLYKKQSQCKLFHDNNSTEICYNQHPISFYQNLTHLALWNCGNIKYAFPSSIAKSLHQLQQLKIINCKVLEEIVAKEDGTNAVVNFNFPNLTSLKLEDLPELTVFYPGINNLELPKLKELVVKNCVKYVSFKENNGETELNILDPKSVFLDNKIIFDLEVFKLDDGEKDIYWQSQSKSLTITNDNSTNIPLRLLQRFEHVRELQLFPNRYKDIKSLCDFPNIEVLRVSYCNRFTSLVPFLASYENLKVLKVGPCYGLIMKLITPSVVRSLVQLRELSISICEMLTEIVENEGDATRSHEIVFDNLNKLSLEHLKSLTCFCSGNYSFSFPSLEELIIRNCPNLKIFCRGSLSTPKLYKVIYVDHFRSEVVEIGENDLNTSIQQKHNKEVDHFSKALTLCERDIMTTLQGEFHENFGKIKTLQLIKDENAYISRNIIMKFNSLEKLILTVSSYEEIFSCGEGDKYIGALAKLKVLELQGLFNLKYIWKPNFQFKSILQELDSLKVEYCHNLMTLLPPSSSFENLTSLKVEECNGMQKLMTSSMAKSLICLKRLSIRRCELMTEVLANEEETEKDEIVFEKLEELSLFELENLTCFCSRNYALKFPFLKSLKVCKCFKMKTFSGEGLNMPRLRKVNWKDCTSDLYSVLQQLQNDCSKLWENFPW